jgi:hypothetical protein
MLGYLVVTHIARFLRSALGRITMYRRFISAVAILALAGVVSTSASAQDSSAMKVGVVVKPSYQVFVTAVNATPATITTLKARPAITAGDVTLVNVRDFPEGQNDSTVVVLLEPRRAEIAQLQAILAAQSDVKVLLEGQTPALTVADVVAVGTQPDGKLLVFYRPKGM